MQRSKKQMKEIQMIITPMKDLYSKEEIEEKEYWIVKQILEQGKRRMYGQLDNDKV